MPFGEHTLRNTSSGHAAFLAGDVTAVGPTPGSPPGKLAHTGTQPGTTRCRRQTCAVAVTTTGGRRVGAYRVACRAEETPRQRLREGGGGGNNRAECTLNDAPSLGKSYREAGSPVARSQGRLCADSTLTYRPAAFLSK